MFGIHICVDLEYKSGKVLFFRFYYPGFTFLRLGHWRNVDKSVQQFADPEIVQGGSEEYRLQITVQIIFPVKWRINGLYQFQLFP